MTVLVVEDDAMIQEGLRYSLEQEGWEVVTAETVKRACALVKESAPFDFCLLDLMLPDGDGYAVCREIRRTSRTPVLFLTACDDEMHTVLALEQGADDYITKPFRIRELMARMQAILRRTQAGEQAASIVTIGENQLHRKTGKLYRGKEEVFLTAMEYKLLLTFVAHRGQTLSRLQILNELWDEAGDFVNDNTLSVYIKRLRKKLGETPDNPMIRTIRGLGYRMEK